VRIVRIAVLGPLTVTDGDGPLPLGGPKSQQVLASLVAAYPRAVSVQALVDELWPDDPPSTAAHVVSTYVSGLRSVLGDRLQSEDGHHRLALASTDVLDTRVLDHALSVASDLVAASPTRALEVLDSTGIAWDARPYATVTTASSTLVAEQRRLEECLAHGTTLRGEALLAAGASAQAVALLAAACARHPYHERLHGLLMLALYREGRQTEALGTYRDLRTTLVTEVGLEPTAELAQLNDQILMHDPAWTCCRRTDCPRRATSSDARETSRPSLTCWPPIAW
jgi:DNA-binding SARP family transcriptional activator